MWPQGQLPRTSRLRETEASRQGQTYHTADGGVIKNKGEKTVTMYSEDGDQFRARYQITDVTSTTQLNRSCVRPRKQCVCSRKLVVGSSIMRQVRYTWVPSGAWSVCTTLMGQ